MNLFVEQLSSIRLNNVFNPYIDKCAHYDLDNAPEIRAKNLNNVLESAIERGADTLWIGRDLGHKGGRRTGLALTDERHLLDLNKRWKTKLEKATKGEAVSENTAKAIWSILNQINDNIFLWNVFPFHPYEHEDEFSNRQHSAREREIGREILIELIDILRIKHIIAIGNDAYHMSIKFNFDNIKIDKVRHPSFGGKNDFNRHIKKLYEIDNHQINLFE